MKIRISIWVAALTAAIANAASLTGVERVQFVNHKVILLPSGAELRAPNTVALPFQIVVATNGTFTVKGGKVRSLEEGDVLGSDGMLIKRNGSIRPVIDHVTLNRGHVLVVKDGEALEPRDVVQLGDGTTVAPDWKITPPVGTPRRLLDGEVFQLEGKSVPARDTITKQNGQVMVQKDGSMLLVPPQRSIMMNEGTKVYGDGTIVTFAGMRSTLSDGEIVVLEGVVTRRR